MIQKPNTKKIQYVEIISKNIVDLNTKPKKTQEYIKNKNKEIKRNYISKLNDRLNAHKITEKEYNFKIQDINNIINIEKNIFKSEYSPLRHFIDDNKNKIIDMEKINDNMYRI